MGIEIFLVIGIVFVLIGLAVVGYFLWQQQQAPKDSPELQQLLESLNRDKEDRYREQESLKNELRENSKHLREEFFRVNKTVDTKLTESSKQLNERLDKSSSVIGSLQKELGKMGEIGSKIENLDKILRAPKGRGSMGEEGLEEILGTVFPQALWERQYAMGTGATVDAVVKTNNGIIPIDAKFPLPAFEMIVNAETAEQSTLAQKEFQKALKARINEVAKYIKPELNTLDFAIMFLPSESIYYEAAIRSREIYEYSREKKVLLTGPNTLVYVLQVILSAYQSQQFAKQAQAALAQLGGVKKQAEKLDEAVRLTATHLGRASSQITSVQTENDKLQNQIERVSSLDVSASAESLETEERPSLL
ncbi:DNA recombination protein RmuC [bacterium]|nr:DNA recombination protein RmuC [bacterium]NCQ55303.1 DNA recombination protein RmuC [Candidatus Parcubacteria bacterium]NCS67184.1 DNA recombination protein RmuC [Candidatus Peregrinibacteria bacterium]NCS96810.1 DNA recombination protein RmuC [bacterium]